MRIRFVTAAHGRPAGTVEDLHDDAASYLISTGAARAADGEPLTPPQAPPAPKPRRRRKASS